jgi:hypothetical protein
MNIIAYITVRRVVKFADKRAVYTMPPGSGIPLFRAPQDWKSRITRRHSYGQFVKGVGNERL